VNPALVATSYALLTVLITAIQNIAVRLAADDGAHSFQVVLFRNLFGLLSATAIILWTDRSLPRSDHALRVALSCVVLVASMATGYYGIAVLPLNESAALGFAMPLFATVGAALFLGEIVRARRWTAVILGFGGVLIILRPGMIPFELGAGMVLLSAMLGAALTLMFKRFVARERAMTLVFYQSLFATLLSVPAAAIVWEAPTGYAAAMMVANGVLGTLGWITFLRACMLTDASALMPFEFLRLPVIAVFAFLLFGEVPDRWVWIGAAVIFGSTLYIAHREATIARAAAARSPESGER
jgi:drug/metabolite transporter (DMT)-like permease